jgi:outer membrane protein OmpA-like peptidoglycan-associated protein
MNYRMSALVCVLFLFGCSSATWVKQESSRLNSTISKHHDSAVACAPKELAQAEAFIEFGRDESQRGRSLQARNHLANAKRLVSIVLKKTAGSGCEGDRDGDAIPDSLDRCPDIPEDFDGEEDEDGCPDYDRDKDGVPDDRDKCPKTKEDRDGFQDNDGCPDYDNDNDGLPDKTDQCPLKAEDFDGYQDLDGCPELDNDGDRIPDAKDKCPNRTGPRSKGGCPDSYRHIILRKDMIVLRKPISFVGRSTRLSPKSAPILDEIVVALRRYRRIKILVEGHATSGGSTAMKLLLSQRRAASVRKYLLKKGVRANRVTAKGLGSQRPITDNSTAQKRKQNRRIEIHVTRWR